MKILVIYATAGAGHRKAAEALYHGLESSTHNVVLVDSLDYTSRFYKYLYSGSYTFVISYLPWLWGTLFSILDLPWLVPVVRLFRRIHNSLNAPSLARYLKEENFDYILSTHFFPNEVAGFLKRKGRIKSKIISVITDFDVHSIWLAEGVDCYAGACGWTQQKLEKMGVPERRIAATGIPTHAKFSSHTDIKALKQRLGLKQDGLTVLIATGSFGIGPIEEIIQLLPDFQVLVVCGHNKDLYSRLSRMENGPDAPRQGEGSGFRPAKAGLHLTKIYGLVDNMDELMAVSDVMITKPGGLSISEALVSGLPLIFFNAIPGQETNNVKVLKEYEVGVSGCPIEEMAQVLHRFQASSESYEAAQEKIKLLAKPSAVKDIIALIQ